MTGGSRSSCCACMRLAMTISVYAEINYRKSDKPSGQALSTLYAIV